MASNGSNRDFFNVSAKIHVMLQTIENALVAAGRNRFEVTTKQGSFRWLRTSRATVEPDQSDMAPPTAPE